MNQSTEIKDLFLAISKVQKTLKGAIKDSNNPFFKSTYADLESCWAACREPLSENGLSIIQTMDYEPNHDFLITTLGHVSGQWIRSKTRIVSVKNDPQAMGSAITYARRYALAAIIGLVQTDDDAESAMNRKGLPPALPKPASIPVAQVIKPASVTSPVPPNKPSEIQKLTELNIINGNDEFSIFEQAEALDLPTEGQPCSLCASGLKKSKAGDTLFCPRFKEKEHGEHDIFRL